MLFISSLVVGVGATLLALGAGVLVALAVAGAGRRLRTLLILLAILNLALPPFLVASHWLDLTSQWRAVATSGALAGGSWLFTALTLASLLWPLVTLLLLGAWSRLQTESLEVDPWIRGWRLLSGFLLPVAGGEMVVAAVMVLTLALANFTVPVLFQVRVLTEEFWIRFNTQLDVAGAFGAAWPLLVVPWVLLMVLRRRGIAWPRWQKPIPAGLFRQRLGRLWTWAVGFSACWLTLTVVFPLVRLMATARTWKELPGAAAAGQSAMWNSLLTSALTATAVVAASLLPAVFGRRVSARGLLWLPFLIPGVFTGVALIAVFNRPSLGLVYQTAAILGLALAIRYFALGAALVSESVAASDPALSDVARSLGAGRWRVFRDALWPQVSHGSIGAWYAVYLLCLWDVESVVLIQPPDGQTLALRIFNLLHYGHAAQVNALCVMLLALALVPWVLWHLGWALHRGLTGRTVMEVRMSLAALGGLLCVSGCSPVPELATTRIESRLFSSVSVIGSRGVAPGQFNKPRSLICDREDNLYVADLTGRIQKFSPDGQYLLQWQMPQTDLGKPKGMGLDREGNILVIEPHYMRVNHFTPDGHRVAQWGVKGTHAGEFILPRGIAQDSLGDFHVSEYTVVDRIQRFTLRPETSSAGGASVGHCVAVLADGTNRLQACPTALWGSPGTEPGQFNRAEGVAVGPGDDVFVADSCNHRIQVFDRDGKFLRSHGRAGSHAGEFSYPYDIRVDSNGTQYICEFGNSRITVLDARDQVIEVIGGAGSAPGQFANPWAVALDTQGNLYIADSQNHRVQKLLRRRSGAIANSR